MNKKILIALVVVLVAAVAGGLVYYFQGGNLQGLLLNRSKLTIQPITVQQTPVCPKGIVYAHFSSPYQQYTILNRLARVLVDYGGMTPEKNNFGEFFDYMKNTNCKHTFFFIPSPTSPNDWSTVSMSHVTCDTVWAGIGHDYGSRDIFNIVCEKGLLDLSVTFSVRPNTPSIEGAFLRYNAADSSIDADYMELDVENFIVIR